MVAEAQADPCDLLSLCPWPWPDPMEYASLAHGEWELLLVSAWCCLGVSGGGQPGGEGLQRGSITQNRTWLVSAALGLGED